MADAELFLETARKICVTRKSFGFLRKKPLSLSLLLVSDIGGAGRFRPSSSITD